MTGFLDPFDPSILSRYSSLGQVLFVVVVVGPAQSGDRFRGGSEATTLFHGKLTSQSEEHELCYSLLLLRFKEGETRRQPSPRHSSEPRQPKIVFSSQFHLFDFSVINSALELLKRIKWPS